jgi:hypothetical protein
VIHVHRCLLVIRGPRAGIMAAYIMDDSGIYDLCQALWCRSRLVWNAVDHLIYWKSVYSWIERLLQLMQIHILWMRDFSVINE